VTGKQDVTGMTRTYEVSGMTCAHCAGAISREVRRLDEVESVDVDLGANTVTVTGGAVDDAAVRAAIDEAGYAVVGAVGD
jgi:copper chaperone